MRFYNKRILGVLRASGKFEVIEPQKLEGVKGMREYYRAEILPFEQPKRTRSNREIFAGIIELYGKTKLDN